MANEALRLIGGGVDQNAHPGDEELKLREVWRALMRRKLVLLAPIALMTLGVFLWANGSAMYTARLAPRPTERPRSSGSIAWRGADR
jgi:hypothetical protein